MSLTVRETIGTAARARDAAGRLLLAISAHGNCVEWLAADVHELEHEIANARNALGNALKLLKGETK